MSRHLPLKRFVEFYSGAAFPQDEQGRSDGELPFVKVSDLGSEGVYVDVAVNYVDQVDARRLGAKPAPAGTIVFPKVGAALLTNRRRVLGTPAVFDNNVMGFRPRPEHDIRWFLYWSTTVDMTKLANPGALPSVTVGQVGQLPIAVPQPAVQVAIADFLDAETARIDALIERKQRFIELLLEKRTALITHAVTKGLDPDVEMKDPGIEWIGDVPRPWRFMRIQHLCRVRRGASPRPIEDPQWFDDDGEYGWVRIEDVTASARLLKKTRQRLSAAGAARSVPLGCGELVLSIAGTVGKPIITDMNCCIHDGFVHMQDLKCDRDYLYYVFAAGEAYKGLGKMGTQLNLNTFTVGNIAVPVPSPSEQHHIVEYLDTETAKIDALIDKTRESIDLLKEHRTALISAAVTGQIDVSAKSVKEAT